MCYLCVLYVANVLIVLPVLFRFIVAGQVAVFGSEVNLFVGTIAHSSLPTTKRTFEKKNIVNNNNNNNNKQEKKQMVYYFTCIDPEYVVYMGRDKYENEGEYSKANQSKHVLIPCYTNQ